MTVKRIVIYVVSLALLVAAIFMANTPQPVSFGKGNGVDAAVQSLADLRNVLRAIEGYAIPSGAAAFAEGDGAAKHTSVTVTLKDNISVQQSVAQTAGAASANSKTSYSLQRTLQLAYTQDAAFTKSEGLMVSTSSSYRKNGSVTVEEKVKQYFDFSLEIYFSAERVLIRAAKLDAAYSRDYTYADSSDSEKNETVHDETGLFEDEVFSALKRNKGKWIDCTDHRDFALEVLAVDDSNREFLSALDLVFAEAERDDSVFEQSGDLYTLSSEKLKELFGVPSDAEDGSEGENALSVQFDGNVTANLSAATSPRLTAVSNIGTTSSVGGNVSEVTGSSNREFLFENIDNTVIHVDVGLQPLLLTDLIEDKKEEEGE